MGSLKLYNIITESIERDMYEGFNETELSEDYPENFDLFSFKNIRSYAEKLRYAEQYLGKPIGRGSSRVVYRVDNDKVLKLAKNKKGIPQNEVEIEWYGETYYDDMLAKVFDYDRDNSLWVEMELAYRVKESDFRKLWGINFKDLWGYLKMKNLENHGRRSMFHVEDDVKEQLDNNDNVEHLVSFMLDSDSPDGDLSKLSSWGLVHRSYGDTIVLIDFGLTNNVYQSYYA
jgi:hypothetical protein